MKKKQKNIISFVILGVLFVIFFFRYNFRIPCIFHEITGLHCPGCGGTRALVSLIKLDIYQAYKYNMLIVIAIPFFIVQIVCRYILKLKYKIPNFVWYILIVIVIIYGVLRNIPYFSFLAPTKV